MLKISGQKAGKKTTLQLEGQVVGPWVEELKRVCALALEKGETLTLDVADVSFLDPEGVALFRGLQQRGVGMRNLSGFLAAQLGEQVWK